MAISAGLSIGAAAQQSSPPQGLAAVRVVGHGHLPKALHLRALEDGKALRLEATPHAVFSSTVFAGLLKPGRYKLDRITLANSVEGVPVHTSDLEADLHGEFEVAAGRMTNLQTLVYVPVSGTRALSDKKISLTTFVDPTAVPMRAIAERLVPEASARPSTDNPLGWQVSPASGPESTAALRRSAVQRFPVLWSPTIGAASGAFLTVGRMGQITRIDPSGARHLFDAGVVHELHAVAELADGRWLVGGEEGWLGISTDQGRSWKAVPSPNANGVVMHLVQVNSHVYAAVQVDDGVLVYRSPSDKLGTWEQAYATRSVLASRYAHIVAEPYFALRDSVVSTAQRLVLYARDGRLHSMDYATERWTSQPALSPHNKGTSASEDGLVIGNISGGVRYGTTDYGQTTYKLETFVFASEPLFRNREHGLMVVSPWSALPTRNWVLSATQDGGRSWTRQADLDLPGPMWSYSLLRWMDREQKVIALVYPPQGRLMVSADGGKTWKESPMDARGSRSD